ncbi:G-protein coupled receptors family 1 profile domain-containing protein [Caenorhabditis elegans]|uniref:G-protein coupled receptors family 1 profile domain-containing protein n=1 Tax=Caenorhabditis elegans TaxID=6239 RepID=Q564Y1_CAEEL|nr:G-protein coupled receptors family 1 profile domain-containing protein [Caenorhabditis elegans]CAI79143.1 G-protein coupled receptors family 1 profile domain-containing protein [Caenorhabditis elegans]|eukprot:NP_001023690.1 Uncharacterized protein CELE_C30G7.5 [Caenorhabditis elegans]
MVNRSIDVEAITNEIYLVTYLLVLVLQVFCIGINGLIIIFFAKIPCLRKNKHLRLVFYLSVGDFFNAIWSTPYIVYMIANWNPIRLDFDPLFILISSLSLPIQLKISAIVTIGIAFSRYLAVFFPVQFRKTEQSVYSETVLAIGLTLGLFDAILWFLLSPPSKVPDCGTSGCFVSYEYRYYWGISNMILGLIVIILSLSFFFKIKAATGVSPQQHHTYHQANRTSTGILISSLCFLTVPSICVGLVELVGFSIFKLLGPFYTACLISSGICNGIIFILCNGDVRQLIRSKHLDILTSSISVVPRIEITH